MMENNDQPLDIHAFLDQLIEELNLKQDAPEKVEQIKEMMGENLQQRLLEAASENIETEVMDEALQKYPDEEDLMAFMQKTLHMSPAAQEAMNQAILNFKEEMLSAYEELSKDN